MNGGMINPTFVDQSTHFRINDYVCWFLVIIALFKNGKKSEMLKHKNISI